MRRRRSAVKSSKKPLSNSFTRTQQVVCGEYTRQMPSVTPDSCTSSRTSSVMSVTWRPPDVTKWRSAWKTFTGASLAPRPSVGEPTTLAESGPVAQRSEHRTHNPSVPGSNPGGPTKNSANVSLTRRDGALTRCRSALTATVITDQGQLRRRLEVASDG